MKLLILIHSLGNGGAERVTANMAGAWADQGWTVTVATLAPTSRDLYPLDPRVRRVGLDLAGDSRSPWQALRMNVRRIREIRGLLRQEAPDVALGMMSVGAVQLALASLGLPRLRRLGMEHTHPPRQPLGFPWQPLRRLAYRWLDHVVVLTRESEAWVRQHTWARQVSAIPNGVPFPLPDAPPSLDPDTLLPPGRPFVLGAGTLARHKGFDRLIQAFAEAAPACPDWDLVILGEGPLRRDLEAQAGALGLDQRIHLPGRAGNMATWYRRAGLFALTSHVEGFPMVLCEAMAHGLPAVAFDCDTGPRDMILHGTNGLLVPQDRTDLLADALREAMGAPDRRLAWARTAPGILDRCSMDAILGAWAPLLLPLSDQVRTTPAR